MCQSVQISVQVHKLELDVVHLCQLQLYYEEGAHRTMKRDTMQTLQLDFPVPDSFRERIGGHEIKLVRIFVKTRIRGLV